MYRFKSLNVIGYVNARVSESILSCLHRSLFNSTYRTTTGGLHYLTSNQNQFHTRSLVLKSRGSLHFSHQTMAKPIQCKAAVVWKANDPISIETVEVAPPAEDEVRVQVKNVGICHSDIIFRKGIARIVKFPCIIGHEGAGIVESVGKDVTSVKPGDHVLLVWNFSCGKCRGCLNPKSNVCDAVLPFVMNYSMKMTPLSRIKAKGEVLFQVVGLGAFSQYTVVHERAVVKINPEVPLHKASLFACCIPTGYGAASFLADITPSSSTVVWGLGAVGLSAVLGCRGHKASKIIGIDINKDKFEIAKKLGCTDVINPLELTKPIKEVIKEMTGGGADYVFVCVGREEVMEEAIECTHQSVGEVIYIGIAENSRNLSLSPEQLVFGRRIRGTWCGGTKREQMADLINLHHDGQIPVDDLITGHMKLEDINEGFQMLEQGKNVIRTVVDL